MPGRHFLDDLQLFLMNTNLCDFHRLYYCFFCRLHGRSVWEGALEGVAHRLWEVCSPLYPTIQKTINALWKSSFYWFHFSNSFDFRQNRPVLNESSPLVLTFGVTLQQIIDVVGGTWKYFDWFNTFSGRKESAPDHLSLAQLGKEVLLIVSVFAIKCTDQFCHDFAHFFTEL